MVYEEAAAETTAVSSPPSTINSERAHAPPERGRSLDNMK